MLLVYILLYFLNYKCGDFMDRKKVFKILTNLISILITIGIIIFIIYGTKSGIFKSRDVLVSYISNYGIFGPIIFIFIQIIQVVFPVIPGGASCFAGVLAFGGIMGFVYNYIGLCIGSICSYLLAKKYGMKIINFFFKEETVNKYIKYVKSKKFDKVFAWGIFLPGAPDDLLCYISGISSMSFKKFLLIILLGKPLTLLFYSLFIYYFPYFIK